MTNYERIKNMSIDELANFLTVATNGCEYGCLYCNNYIDGECVANGHMYDYVKGCIEWLKSEAKECKA